MKRLIRLPEVMHRVGLSRSTIYQYIEEGRFPAQVRLGRRCVAWNYEEIDSWIEEKLAGNSSPK